MGQELGHHALVSHCPDDLRRSSLSLSAAFSHFTTLLTFTSTQSTQSRHSQSSNSPLSKRLPTSVDREANHHTGLTSDQQARVSHIATHLSLFTPKYSLSLTMR